ncbi:Crp/Fnr family transcriptional regulator [Intestinibacillus massiliensis]|uniref:Crp/Fnr family transcriptional regulator n=1 Tax=Intestinibacillus massiliensis TaxID=1871029 RepID=UPI000B34C016|nr:Crp/Fnr family transcriptional regulator [Intestinibacillus massiliensis]
MKEYFPFWNKLTAVQQALLRNAVTERHAKKGEVLHNGSEDCVGLLLVKEGQLRAYMLSEEGREITLYRLLDRDICLFSASCVLHSIAFDVSVQAERDTVFLHIPSSVYQELMQQSAAVANYTNEVMASRFSDVMWLMDQVLYKRMDARVAAFLLEESALAGTAELKITHEAIARHLGSAREVVTRMLKYLQNEGAVAVSRGGVTITDAEALGQIAGDSLR